MRQSIDNNPAKQWIAPGNLLPKIQASTSSCFLLTFHCLRIAQTILFRWKMFSLLILAEQKSAAMAKVKVCVDSMVRAHRHFLAPCHTP